MRTQTVLLVDDSTAFLAAASKFLADFCNVAVVGTAQSGEEGVRLAEAIRPDIALVDFKLPGIGGLEVVSRLKALRYPPIVIMVSFNSENEYRKASLLRGCDAFVSKTDFTDEIGPVLEKFSAVGDL